MHFTILRPPEKQDGTPINELSLIAFPTRELFQQKINEFQLIIFDRYARQGVLPIAYFDNIARYVRAGGAVLVSAGPDYASTTSIWRTPLDSVLPAEPVGVTEKPFYAHLSDAGKRHPVTRGLEGSASEPPHWSRFFRTVETRNATAAPVMTGADGKPLLLLSRYGEGRVALLLSDHIWLWARGYEGGGPHLDLLRRMSHWLMKQPDLDEEALRLQVQGHDLVVLRQTMADSVTPVTVTSPSGATRELTLSASESGTWRSTVPADELGLWQATDGTLKALINVGPTNPKEFSEVTSTTEMLRPLAQATGGDARRVVDGSKHRASTHRAGARIERVSRRRLDGRENARCQRRQRRRRAADVRRPDRPAVAAWRIRSHLAARGPLEHDPEKWIPVFRKRSCSNKRIKRDGEKPFRFNRARLARRCVKYTGLTNSHRTQPDYG